MNYNQLTGEINGERSGLEIKALTVQINGERSGFEIKAHDIETYVWPHLRNKKDTLQSRYCNLVTLLISVKIVTKLHNVTKLNDFM